MLASVHVLKKGSQKYNYFLFLPLSVTVWPLPITNWPLPVTNWSLPALADLLLTTSGHLLINPSTWCPLPVTNWQLLVSHRNNFQISIFKVKSCGLHFLHFLRSITFINGSDPKSSSVSLFLFLLLLLR